MLAVSTELNKLVRIGNYLTPQSSQSLCSLTHSMYCSLATLDTIRLINVVSAAVAHHDGSGGAALVVDPNFKIN